MAYTIFDIGACNCPSAACNVLFTVEGCATRAYSGVTVSVYASSGGTLLDSGTTNGGGQVTLSWTGSSGSYWVTVTGISSRFQAYAQTLSLRCGGGETIALTPAAGYYCLSGCLLPLAGTLNGSDSILGAYTLTYSTTLLYWVGSMTYSYPGGDSPEGTFCPAADIPIAISWGGGALAFDGYVLDVAGGPGECPYSNAFGTSASTLGTASGTFTCPPSMAFDYTLTPSTCTPPTWLFDGATSTGSLTE